MSRVSAVYHIASAIYHSIVALTGDFSILYNILIFNSLYVTMSLSHKPNMANGRVCVFTFGKNVNSTCAFSAFAKVCVTAIGVVRFSVRGFGCALFYSMEN